MSYPTTIDSFQNPGTKLSSNPHSSLHTAEATALVAIETKLGADSSGVTTSVDYKLTNPSSISPGHKHVTADLSDAGSFIPTGGIIPYAGSSSPTNFLLCDGSAVSRTTYATLFSIVSTTYGTGDGATTFNIPDLRSRSVVGVGTGTKVLTFVSRSSNNITVSGSANAGTNEVITGQLARYHTSGSVMTGLTNNTDYYLIRQAYNQFSLATTLANAQSGTAISLSGDGSGTQTFTYTLTARSLGDTGGEETHAMSSTELLAHTHTVVVTAGSSSVNATGSSFAGSGATGSAGGNVAMNNMSPFLALNYIIRT